MQIKSTLRILSLEDSEDDFDFINVVLRKAGFDFTATRVDAKDTFIKSLSECAPDVILSDHSLPGFDSTEALKIAKKKCPETPFILVTGAVSDEFAVNALKAGADDYLLKSNLVRLPSVIEHALKHKESEQAKRKSDRELAKRNDELSKINRELDTFVYSVSHNLRAPLMSVLGLVNLASDEKDISNIHQYHQLMRQSILKLDSTLQEILEYSRNAREEIKIERIHFENVIAENLKKMQFMPGFADIVTSVNVHSPVEFHCDSYRLSVIFNNFISNSVKYLDRTKPKSVIDISVEVTDERALIEFTDNGIGIDTSLQPRVFDMFFRATQVKEGAGLGLYIVKEAVEMLQGLITVKSEFGEGTTFTVSIPNHAKKKRKPELDSLLIDRD
ncbi:MAG TPA: ATP-binding protein [Chryseosolibacter sp.]